jgi:putative transcriptional regulator
MSETSLGGTLIAAMKEVQADVRGEARLPRRSPLVLDKVDVLSVRKATGLSRQRFAAKFGLDLRAVQDWEQGRRQPERAARILLKVIERHPEVVEEVLGGD